MSLIYKLETFENCKEVKHIIIIITAIIYIFLFYLIFDQQLKITFRKSSAPAPEKIHSPLFAHFPLKIQIQKVQVSLLFPTLKIFQLPVAERGEVGHW